ncbi:MAG: hypothetical protein HYY18_08280 [Planctomycetes bacterium]|nr:hypothetical protein [Planctomycetota bacterium]
MPMRLPPATLAAVLLFTAPASADWRFERRATWEVERPGGGAERSDRREVVWLGDGKVRVDDRVSRESWIVRADQKAIRRIDHAAGTWCEWSFEEGAAARAVVAADVRTALGRVAGSDDEAGLRRFLDAFAPPDVETTLREAGAGPKTAGRETRNWALASKTEVIAEARIADSMSGLDRLAAALGAAGLIPARQAEAWAKAKGMAVAATWTLVFPDAVVREEFEVTKAEEAEAPADTYEVPEAYRRVAPPTLLPGSAAREAPRGGYDGDRPTDDSEGKEEDLTGEEAGKDD